MSGMSDMTNTSAMSGANCGLNCVDNDRNIIDHNISNDASVVNEEVIDSVNKILVHISDDLVYTLPITGNTFQSLLDAISADEQLKSEWHSWQRFVLKPELYYLFIYDTEFGEYVRYRRHNPISHLSKIKIKSKLNANNGSVGDNHPNRPTEHVLDEPTDALVCEPHNITSNSSDVVNIGSYCRYSLNSPSAPLTPLTPHTPNTTHTPLTNLQTKAAKKVFDSTLASTSALSSASASTVSAIASATATCIATLTSTSGTVTAVTAARKLFDSRPNVTHSAHKDCNAEIESDGDLYEDAPTEPLYEWTPEATANFLELCKLHRNEISSAKNLSDVKRSVWEQISRDLNSRDVGYFDPLSCRNRFSRLRSTYTNIICYPTLISESRWPYLDMIAEIIGNKPLGTTALSQIKDKVGDKKQRFSYPTNHRRGSATKTSNSNTKNQEVSELYVALLNLVKKYTDDFLTGKKYETWDKIATEMNAAGYKWGGNALRGLFHRLRYGYLNVLRSVEYDEELANTSWPYFRYFQNIDLTAFKGRKAKTIIPNKKSRSSLQKMKAKSSLTSIKAKTNSLRAQTFKRNSKSKLSAKSEQIKVKVEDSLVKRTRGRPRKAIIDETVTDSQNTDPSNYDQINVNGNDCEVRFFEYSEDDSHENIDALNKKRIKTS